MKHFLVFILILFLATVLLRDLPKTYFQQDEWHNFGYIILNNFNILQDIQHNWVAYITGTMRFLAIMLSFFLFSAFGFHANYYAYTGILFHSINAFFVYYLVFYLLHSRKIAFGAAFLFLINSAHTQAYMWFGTISGTLPNAAFSLLSLIFFFKYLKEEKRKYYIFSIILLLISVSFKETSIFLVAFYFLLAYFWNPKKEYRNFKTFFYKFRLLLLVAVGLSLIYLTPVAQTIFKSSSSPVGGPTISGEDKFLALGYNIITYPLEALTQVFVVSIHIFDWANKITHAKFNNLYASEIMRLSVVAEYITVMISFLILVGIFLAYQHLLKNKNKERKLLILFTLFIFLSVLPFVLLQKSIAILESRHYYLPTIGASVLFAILLKGIVDNYSQKKVSRNYGLILIAFSAFLLLFFWDHISFVQMEVQTKEGIGESRKMIVEEVPRMFPNIDKTAVFYSESDEFPYGPDTPTMPFQSGFGQLLVVLYSYRGAISPEFNKNDFLWGIHDEGYKKIDGYGFGYYKTYNTLVDSVKKNDIDINTVYAMRWKGKKLYDISQETRKRLAASLEEQ